MRSMKRRTALSIGTAIGILAVASIVVSVASGGGSKSLKGGTYRVGWESSFGWTDSFDPTGEYLANSFAINTNLLLRGLVGYNHVAGAAGAVVVAGSRDDGAEADERRDEVHVQAQERDQVRPAAEPRDHVAGRQVRGRAHGAAEERRPVRVLLHRDPGAGTRTRKGKAQVDRRDQDPEREDDRLQPRGSRPATSCFASRMPAAYPMPAEVAQVLRGPARERTASTSSRRART